MAIEFGVPKQRVNKVEEFPSTPVVKMVALVEGGKGLGRKFEFNVKACELMGLVPGMSKVNFAFDPETKCIYVGKHNDDDAMTLNKNKTVSNKKTYETIVEWLALDTTKENNFALVNPVELSEEVTVYELSLMMEEMEAKEPEVKVISEDDGTEPVDEVTESEPEMEAGAEAPFEEDLSESKEAHGW